MTDTRSANLCAVWAGAVKCDTPSAGIVLVELPSGRPLTSMPSGIGDIGGGPLCARHLEAARARGELVRLWDDVDKPTYASFEPMP